MSSSAINTSPAHFSLDLGPNTDLTLLASYNKNKFLRQQGLTAFGTLLPNRNGSIPLSGLTAEPGASTYDTEQYRLGYALEHRFAVGQVIAGLLSSDSAWVNAQNIEVAGGYNI